VLRRSVPTENHASGGEQLREPPAAARRALVVGRETRAQAGATATAASGVWAFGPALDAGATPARKRTIRAPCAR